MKRRELLLAALAALPLAALAKPVVHVLEGKFLRVEQGDYVHLVVRDAKGEERTFFVGPDRSFESLLEHPERLRGTRVRVRWHTVKRNIPEAGGPMDIEEALSLQVL